MIKTILKIYFLSLIVFTLFRVILLISNKEYWDDSYSKLFLSLLIGVRFDTVIICYILALPILLWMIFYCLGRNNFKLNFFLYLYCAIFFSVAFTISTFDIPYFNQFFSRLDKVAFQWIDSPAFILEMIVKDFRLWGYIFPFLILMFGFHYLLKKIFKNINELDFNKNKKLIFKISQSLSILILIFIGIRGRLEAKSPIRVGTAYFSDNAFFNKVGLNPNFTLIQSLLQKDLIWKDLMPTDKAVSLVKKDFGITKSSAELPILQYVTSDYPKDVKPNMVIVLMESMTVDNMKYFGNSNNLTPVLDNLVHKSVFFENAYSEGIHTYNGIYGTLFSFPALWKEHSLKNSKNYESFPKVLKKEGYSTTFFTTHDSQFDNIEGFLYENYFQKVYSQKDFPSSEIHSNLGVSDDYLFRFGIKKMNEMSQSGKPFFCTMLSASNHAPIEIPEYFHPTSQDLQGKAIQYADWSIGQFIKQAQKQKWFKNTIFVFVADHGAGYDKTYDMSLSYNHIPLFFYAPFLLKNSEIKFDFINQIDIIPSLLGLTGISYSKNNLGINIWKEKRAFSYFSADDKIGIINNDFFLIYHKDGSENLYHYRNKDLKNYASEYPDLVQKMKDYAFSNIQTAYFVKKKMK